MDYITPFLVLMIMIGGMLLVAWLVRRFGVLPGAITPSGNSSIQITESKALDTRSRLFVVQWEGARLLIAKSEAGITVLDRHPVDGKGETLSSGSDTNKTDFGQTLKQAIDTAP